jgi:D-xylose transport system ATP-binding protein
VLGIATVYQDLALCDNLDVVANLFLGRERSGRALARTFLDEPTMESETVELLRGLAASLPAVRRRVDALSGGQRQIVAIARALLGSPKVVLLDEPTAALGVSQTKQVLALIRQLKGRGLAVVVISHNLADVFAVADRIFVLRLGRAAGAFATAETSAEQVVSAMTGAALAAIVGGGS